MIMKRILLFTIALGFAISTFAQQRAVATKELRNKAVPMEKAITESNFTNQQALPQADFWPPEEDDVIWTRYDLQSNSSSCQSRIHVYEDGTIGVVATYAVEDGAFGDRGTGYNYYDGSEWGEFPTERIETDRTGWPSYAAFGENGEIAASHYSGQSAPLPGAIAFSWRDEKGTGDWQHFDFFGPADHEDLLWPRMTTGGVDNSVIHLIALTKPVANGGTVYEGMDGALLYSRSTDGGVTWDPENYLDPEMNIDYYLGISGDTYEIASRGDVVAYVAGDAWSDLVMMKSEDAGLTWTKTVIWTNPYPLWTTGTVTDTFYCADGAQSVAIDQTGKAHVAFGVNRALSVDGTAQSWFPYVDGLAYWNEDRPTFSDDINALNPYGEAGTELVDDYSLVGWAQDLDNNGVWDVLGECGLYYVGASSMPQIHVDDNNYVYIVYASITESYNNGAQDFRHLWARVSPNGGEWWGSFEHLTSDLVHIFDECVFPSISEYSDDNIYIAYQVDQEPGLHVRGDEDPPTDNYIKVMTVSKEDIEVGVKESGLEIGFEVAQNTPNPFTGSTTVAVNVKKATDLTLEVTNMMGQVVYTYDAGHVGAGLTRINIDGNELSKGVYFYTVKAGKQAVTNKMIVE